MDGGPAVFKTILHPICYLIVKHICCSILFFSIPGRCMWRAQCRQRAPAWPSRCCPSGSCVWPSSPDSTVWRSIAITGQTSSLGLSSGVPSPLSWWDSHPQMSDVCCLEGPEVGKEKVRCATQPSCSRNSRLCYLLCMDTCFHEIPYMYIKYCLTLAAAARYLFIYSDDEWAPVECFLPAAEERDNNHLFPLWSSFFLVHLTEKGHRFLLQWLEGLERAGPWLGLTQPLHTKLYKYWSCVKHYIAIS